MRTEEAKSLARGIMIFGVFIIALIALFSSIYTIQTGQEGVLLTFNKADPVAREDGLHFKVPFVQDVVKFDIKTQKYVTGASAASKDLQIVTSELAVNYRLAEGTTPATFREVGVAYEDRIIQPLVQEVVKSTTAQYTAEQLITRRAEVSVSLQEQLAGYLEPRNIIVEEVSIVDFDFSESFNDAIEAKVTAEQQKLKADRDLERIRVEAQQAIAEAEGAAESKLTIARAEAESIRIRSEQLKANAEILDWEAVQRWNGVLPTVTGGAVPFVDVMSVGTTNTTAR